MWTTVATPAERWRTPTTGARRPAPPCPGTSGSWMTGRARRGRRRPCVTAFLAATIVLSTGTSAYSGGASAPARRSSFSSFVAAAKRRVSSRGDLDHRRLDAARRPARCRSRPRSARSREPLDEVGDRGRRRAAGRRARARSPRASSAPSLSTAGATGAGIAITTSSVAVDLEDLAVAGQSASASQATSGDTLAGSNASNALVRRRRCCPRAASAPRARRRSSARRSVAPSSAATRDRPTIPRLAAA